MAVVEVGCHGVEFGPGPPARHNTGNLLAGGAAEPRPWHDPRPQPPALPCTERAGIASGQSRLGAREPRRGGDLIRRGPWFKSTYPTQAPRPQPPGHRLAAWG